MRTLFVWISLVGLFFLLPGCGQLTGSGNLVSELRDVSDFDAIDVGGITEVVFQQGPSTRVEVTADDNLISLVETKVKSNTLHIRLKKRSSYSDATIRVRVTAPSLKGVDCSGAATFRTQGTWQRAEGIRIDASGASDVDAELDAPKVTVKSSGAATVSLRGKTQTTDLDASGSATVRSSGLLAEEAKLDASGAASIHAFGSIRIKANASGAAGIRHTGGGAVESRTSGAGSVSPL